MKRGVWKWTNWPERGRVGGEENRRIQNVMGIYTYL